MTETTKLKQMNISLNANLYATVPYKSMLPTYMLFPILSCMMKDELSPVVILNSECHIETAYTHKQDKDYKCRDDEYYKKYKSLRETCVEAARTLIEAELRFAHSSLTYYHQIGIDLFAANPVTRRGAQCMSLDNEGLKKILKLAKRGAEDVVLTFAVKGLNFST